MSQTNAESMGHPPLVSAIMAVYNEAPFVEAAVGSILQQDTPDFDLEVLVVDGMSTDGTRDQVLRLAAQDSRVKLLANPKRTAPCAFNVGLRAAHGEFVALLGAHARYPREYLATCLVELRARDAVGCSGRLVTLPANESLSAALVAWTLASRFASSGSSVRTQAEGYVDTIPFPVMRKQALIEAGGYDEELDRNQDNDMNQRLRARGHRLFLTAKTEAIYYARPDVRSLLRYAYCTARWHARSMRKNSSSMGLRHFVPLVFVAVLLMLAAVGTVGPLAGSAVGSAAIVLLALALGTHLLLGTAAGMGIVIRERRLGALLMPFVILSFHVAYGLGTAAGMIAEMGGRGRPTPAERDRQDASAAKRKPKIVHLTTVHPAFDVRIFHKQCRSLAQAAYDVVLLAPHTRDEVVDGVRIKALPRFDNRLARMSRAVVRAAREAIRQDADVYHFHDPELIPAGWWLALRGKQVIYDVHEDVPSDILNKDYLPVWLRRPLSAVAKLVQQTAVKRFVAVVPATGKIAHSFRAHGRVITVRNYPILQASVPRNSDWNQRACAVAYIGAVTRNRGIGKLVEAMSLLPESLPARLKLAGPDDEGYRQRLQRLTGWDRTDDLGVLSRAEVERVLGTVRAGMLVFLPIANHIDAEPNKLFEYMAAGIPVIASDFPLWREIVTGVGCGLLIDPARPHAIAHAIGYLLTHSEEARQMGERGARAVQRQFNWETQERLLLSLYAELTGVAASEPARAIA